MSHNTTVHAIRVSEQSKREFGDLSLKDRKEINRKLKDTFKTFVDNKIITGGLR